MVRSKLLESVGSVALAAIVLTSQVSTSRASIASEKRSPTRIGADVTHPTGTAAEDGFRGGLPELASYISSRWKNKGYVNVVTDYRKNALIILWAGKAPWSLRKFLQNQQSGVRTTLMQGRLYSQSSCVAGRSRLYASGLLSPYRLRGIGVNVDGSGLTLRIGRTKHLSAFELKQLKGIARIQHLKIVYGVKDSPLY